MLFRLLKLNPDYELDMVSHTALPPTPLSTVTLHQLLSCGHQFKYFCIYDTPCKEQQADNFRKMAEKYQGTLLPIKTKVEGSAEALTGVTYYLTRGKNGTYVFGIRITQANKVSENGEVRFFQGASHHPVIEKALIPITQLMMDNTDADQYPLHT